MLRKALGIPAPPNTGIILLLASIPLGIINIRVWRGILNVSYILDGNISSIRIYRSLYVNIAGYIIPLAIAILFIIRNIWLAPHVVVAALFTAFIEHFDAHYNEMRDTVIMRWYVALPAAFIGSIISRLVLPISAFLGGNIDLFLDYLAIITYCGLVIGMEVTDWRKTKGLVTKYVYLGGFGILDVVFLTAFFILAVTKL